MYEAWKSIPKLHYRLSPATDNNYTGLWKIVKTVIRSIQPSDEYFKYALAGWDKDRYLMSQGIVIRAPVVNAPTLFQYFPTMASYIENVPLLYSPVVNEEYMATAMNSARLGARFRSSMQNFERHAMIPPVTACEDTEYSAGDLQYDSDSEELDREIAMLPAFEDIDDSETLSDRYEQGDTTGITCAPHMTVATLVNVQEEDNAQNASIRTADDSVDIATRVRVLEGNTSMMTRYHKLQRKMELIGSLSLSNELLTHRCQMLDCKCSELEARLNAIPGVQKLHYAESLEIDTDDTDTDTSNNPQFALYEPRSAETASQISTTRSSVRSRMSTAQSERGISLVARAGTTHLQHSSWAYYVLLRIKCHSQVLKTVYSCLTGEVAMERSKMDGDGRLEVEEIARRSISLTEARSGSGGVDKAQVLNNDKSDGSQMGETEMMWQAMTKVGSAIGHAIEEIAEAADLHQRGGLDSWDVEEGHECVAIGSRRRRESDQCNRLAAVNPTLVVASRLGTSIGVFNGGNCGKAIVIWQRSGGDLAAIGNVVFAVLLTAIDTNAPSLQTPSSQSMTTVRFMTGLRSIRCESGLREN
ncbi:hypothetical protein DFJ73DRAFT_956854 [Zopfochytrium polystomum]|nr:hypothetical protein DFJ73DRAFT_956854 [Zopfochytrium polystomum]